MPTERTLRAKFTPFPRLKRAKGQRGPIEVDLEKIKEMYVTGKHFRWTDFCNAHNFNRDSQCSSWFKNHVDWEEWKRAWIREHSVLQDEEITEELMDVRKLVAVERIKHVKTWTKTAANLHALLQHLMNQHMMDAAWDQQNKLAIESGRAQRRCKLTVDEIRSFSAASQRIEALGKAALLVVVDPRQAQAAADEATEEKDEKIPEFEILPMGDITTAQQRTALLASYFDQFQTPKELPAPEVKDAAEDQS